MKWITRESSTASESMLTTACGSLPLETHFPYLRESHTWEASCRNSESEASRSPWTVTAPA